MAYRARHSEVSIRTLFRDQFAAAAEAVVRGRVQEGHRRTLAAFAERDGIDSVARALARIERFRGPSREWWRCTLLLSQDLSAEDALRVTRELIAIEDAGGGPAFDADLHALQVGAALRYLQAHLQRVLDGIASSEEHSAARMVVQAVRVAKARVGMGPERA